MRQCGRVALFEATVATVASLRIWHPLVIGPRPAIAADETWMCSLVEHRQEVQIMKRQTSNAFLTLFVIGSIGGASLVLTATYLMLGGKQADPMVLALGLAAVVLMLAGLGRAAFRAGFGFMDDVMDAKQDEPRK